MKGRQIAYSAEERAWLAANRDLPRRDLHAKFRDKFGRADVSVANIKSYCTRQGWRTGRTGCFPKGNEPHNKGKAFPVAANHPNCRKTQFRKGQLPHNTKYLGHERVSKDGYVEISVEETNPHTGFERRYVLKHRWLWEKAHGPVPDGHALKCLNGDRSNSDPTNWVLVPRALLPRLNGRFAPTPYDSAAPEVKPLIMASARLKHRVRQVLEKDQ